ncbi:MAG: YqgE/AlgH family protein, partial [Nitrospira sp.]|nr:YqgE/AlgH family protein [Nitrospira sp.]
MDQEIEKGKLLIAMPILVDPNFRQTVVLLCEHGPNGSLGLVINRPTEVDASTFVDELPDLAGTGQIYAGGPVSKDAMLVLCHGHETLKDQSILKNVFLVKDLEMLKLTGQIGPEARIRCYLGYAGWAPGQLEAEITAGAWRPIPGDTGLIFGPTSAQP